MDSLRLKAPKKQPDGKSYQLALEAPCPAPSLRWDVVWIPTEEWLLWADRVRTELIGQLLSHPGWFSRPPRRDTLEGLFAPWAGRRTGSLYLAQPTPAVPNTGQRGSAVWSLTGLTMSSSGLQPIWGLTDIIPDSDDDRISLFGSEADGETVDGRDADDPDAREIRLEDIASAPPAATPTKIRSREWESRKFLAKERVREARLKAQIADRLARKEEERFYAQFGDLDEAESHFSDYDLSDEEGAESVNSEQSD